MLTTRITPTAQQRTTFGNGVEPLYEHLRPLIHKRLETGLPVVYTGFDVDGTMLTEGLAASAKSLVKTLREDGIPLHYITNNIAENIDQSIQQDALPMPDVLTSLGGIRRQIATPDGLVEDELFNQGLANRIPYVKQTILDELDAKREVIFPATEVVKHHVLNGTYLPTNPHSVHGVVVLKGLSDTHHEQHQAILKGLTTRLAESYPASYGDIVTNTFQTQNYVTQTGEALNPEGRNTLYSYNLVPFNKAYSLEQLPTTLANITGKAPVITFTAGDTMGDIDLVKGSKGTHYPSLFTAVGNADKALKDHLATYPEVTLPNVELDGGTLREVSQSPPRYAYQAAEKHQGPDGIMAGYKVLKQLFAQLTTQAPKPAPQPNFTIVA